MGKPQQGAPNPIRTTHRPGARAHRLSGMSSEALEPPAMSAHVSGRIAPLPRFGASKFALDCICNQRARGRSGPPLERGMACAG